MSRIRGFEVVKAWEMKGIHLPERKTSKSSGYDLESAEDVILAPYKTTVLSTGLKAYMQEDEYLAVYIRSSLAIKHGIVLINSTGIIDADYYNNPDNEGHIMIAVYNTTDSAFTVNKGDRIAQGIFAKYYKADNDSADGTRTGGVGSTGT